MNPDSESQKGTGTESHLEGYREGEVEKAREFQKNSSALLTMPKPLTVWITINCGKF